MIYDPVVGDDSGCFDNNDIDDEYLLAAFLVLVFDILIHFGVPSRHGRIRHVITTTNTTIGSILFV